MKIAYLLIKIWASFISVRLLHEMRMMGFGKKFNSILTAFRKAKSICLLVLAACLAITSPAAAQVNFIPNHGQWTPEVLYKADIPGGVFFVEKTGLTYYFFDGQALHRAMHNSTEVGLINTQVIKVKFQGSAGPKAIEEKSLSTMYHNYFMGNDPSKWVSGVRPAGTVVLKDLWKGIDLEINGQGEGIKYNFIVDPRADVNRIKLKYEGMDSLCLKDGELHMQTSLGTMTESKPVSYQQVKKEYQDVKVSYVLEGNVLGFSPGKYSRKNILVIDPTVVFSTFSGSLADNFGFTATYDKDGNAYSGGAVYTTGFPTKAGVFQQQWAGGVSESDQDFLEFARDCGILKFSPDGTKLLWATHIGGSHNEQPHSMVINSAGELVILGTTRSSNFPTSANAFDRSINGNYDIFVFKLSADGKTMLASTFLGGSDRDGLNGYPKASFEPKGPLAYNYGDEYRGEVIVDANDNVLIATSTQSNDFPASTNSFQPGYNGNQDGVVAKFTSSLNNLIWSSFLGGGDADATYGITLDRNGDIFVCGGTLSNNFPVKAGAYMNRLGDRDGYIVKIQPDGKAIMNATFLGTTMYDQAYFVQCDLNTDKIYVTGQTRGPFPVSPGVFRNPGGKQFIAAFANDLSAMQLSTVFGSGRQNIDLSPSAFLVDLCGRVYVSGWGGEVNQEYNPETGTTYSMQVTSDGFQKTTDGNDFYLIIIAKNLSEIVYASYFGGNQSAEHVDGGTSRFDRDGKVYQSVCAGCGGHSDFPTTKGAWSQKNLGRRPGESLIRGCNNAVFKIDLNSSNFPPVFKDTTLIVTGEDEFTYNFEVTDADPGDTIFITYDSDILDPKRTTPPIATLDIDSIGNRKITGRLHWLTACNHVSNDTYYVNFTIFDNGCPTPRITKGRIKIVVQAPPVPPPPGIFCLNRRNDHTLELNWAEFELSKYVEHYRLIKRWPNGQEEIIKTFNSSQDHSYLDENAPGHLTNDYCYFIYGVNICGTRGDSTRTICSVPDEDSIPTQVDIFTVTVENNKNVRVIWHKYTRPDFYRYTVFRKENKPNANWVIYHTVKDVNDTSMLDEKVNVQTTSYCYRILVGNQCGLESPGNIYSCSILLTGKSAPFQHDLTWNEYMTWDQGVKKYEVIRRDPSKPDSAIITGGPGFNNHVDDKLNYDEGLYWYRIIAYENPNDTTSAKSVSNEIQLIQAPLLHVPNAFTINGDSLNEVWNVVPVFVKDYHIKVFNRWGEKVWETTNKKELWKGIYREHDPFMNVFIWQTEYTGWDHSRNFKHGYVTILR